MPNICTKLKTIVISALGTMILVSAQPAFAELKKRSVELNETHFQLPQELLDDPIFADARTTIYTRHSFVVEQVMFGNKSGMLTYEVYHLGGILDQTESRVRKKLKRQYPEHADTVVIRKDRIPLGYAFNTTFYPEGETCFYMAVSVGEPKRLKNGWGTTGSFVFGYCEPGNNPDLRAKAFAWASKMKLRR